MYLAGAGGDLRVGEWFSGELEADWINSLTVTGAGDKWNRGDYNYALDGDLHVDVTMNGANPRTGLSLGRLSVKGVVASATVSGSGGIGNVTVGAAIGSDFLAGIARDVDGRPANPDDFLNPLASIGSFTVKGVKSSYYAPDGRFFADSHLSAARLGRVSLKNIDYANEGVGFGLYVLDQNTGKEIQSIAATDMVTGEKWRWPLTPVGGEIDFEVRLV
jgi:hypothetical protein